MHRRHHDDVFPIAKTIRVQKNHEIIRIIISLFIMLGIYADRGTFFSLFFSSRLVYHKIYLKFTPVILEMSELHALT